MKSQLSFQKVNYSIMLFNNSNMGTEINFKEALKKAKRALQKYYKENHLDPSKDYSKDPIHGDMVTNLILRLNRERDKLQRKYPVLKIKSNLKRLRTMTKKVKEAKASKKEKKASIVEAESKKKVKKEAKEKTSKDKKEKTKKPTKYDYPLIDGREMNSIEKKKYRMEQRKLNKTKEDSGEAKESKKKVKKEAKEKTSKTSTKKDVKKKKIKKEED